MLLRDSLVFFISLLSSAALAMGSNPSSPPKLSVDTSSRRHPYQRPKAVQNSGGQQQPNSQGGSSSSSSSRVSQNKSSNSFSISALLGLPTVVKGEEISGQDAPVLPPLPLPSLPIPVLPPLALLSLPVPSPLPVLLPLALPVPPPAPLPLPDSTHIAQGFHEVTPSLYFDSPQRTILSQQQQSKISFDFNTPAAKQELQELQTVLKNPKELPMILRIHSAYLPSVAELFANANNPLSFSSITLELYELQMQNSSEEALLEQLLKFLAAISPKLTKLSFINCVISSKKMEKLHREIETESTFLENIAELKFITTRMGISAFMTVLSSFTKNLQKLKLLTLNIKPEWKEKERMKEEMFPDLQEAMKSAVDYSKNRGILILAGSFFADEIIMIPLREALHGVGGAKEINKLKRKDLDTKNEIVLSQTGVLVRPFHSN